MDKVLVLFDFDGTITNKDTFLELIKFHRGKWRFYTGMIYLSPVIVLHKAGLINAQTLKEKVITFFWKNIESKEFDAVCQGFTKKELPGMLRKGAVEKINEYKLLNYKVAVVSASAEEWVKPFCNELDIECIGSRLQKQNGKLTGKLEGKNCNKEEKVSRISSFFNLQEYKKIIAFGDTSGDIPMLKLASEPNYKPFR